MILNRSRKFLRQHIKFIISLLLAVLILWWFGRNLVTNWSEVGRRLASVDWWLLAAGIATVSITYLQRAYRWRTLLAPLSKAGLRPLFAATTIGFSAVFLFGRMGEVVRPVVLPLYDRRVKATGSFVTIMIERLCDIVAIVVLFAVNLLWFPAPPGRETQLASIRTVGLIMLALTAVGLAFLVWFERHSRPIIGWFDVRFQRWRFVPKRLAHALTHLLDQLAAALSILADARQLTAAIAWTTVIWIFNTLSNWLVIRAFHLPVPFGMRENIFVMGWSLVGSLVPTPGGGAGAFHVATAAGLIFLRPDLSGDTAAAVAILLHLVAFAPALLWGLYYFLRGDVTFKRLQHLTTAEEIEHSIEQDDEPRVDNEVMPDEMNAVGVRN